MRLVLWTAVAFTVLSFGLVAQGNCATVHDINRQTSPLSSNPQGERVAVGGVPTRRFVTCGKYAYFVAEDGQTGRELWRTDGTPAGTSLVKDIYPGPSDSDVSSMVCCNGRLFFVAEEGVHGLELWTSDGTASGTVMVKDIRTGIAASQPRDLACANRRVYFTSDDGKVGRELWSSDGTAAGTVLVKDLVPGTVGSTIRYLVSNAAGNGVLFQSFAGNSGFELWSSDGTAVGTKLLKDIHAGPGSSYPDYFVNVNGVTLFRASHPTWGRELWRTDGTATGTKLVRDLNPGKDGSLPFRTPEEAHAIIGTEFYFSAYDRVSGRELWKTDGTTAGTKRVADITPGVTGSRPRNFHANGSTLYFTAAGKASDLHVLRAGKVTEIGTTSLGGIGFTSLGSKVLFAATTRSYELWITDGTTTGTKVVKVAEDNVGAPTLMTSVGGKVVFAAEDRRRNGAGRELWESDGTPAGTKPLVDIYPGIQTGPAYPRSLTCVGGRTLFLSANDGKSGSELWKIDRSGASLVKDIRPGPYGSYPSDFASCWAGGRLRTLFHANDETHGEELWVTDGTPRGTSMVMDFSTGQYSTTFYKLIRCGSKVFLSIRTWRGRELWITDGTPAGTKLVTAEPSPFGGNSYVCADGKLYFANYEPKTGHELYVTDGTPAGTRLVKDIVPGIGSSVPSVLTAIGNRVVFLGRAGLHGSRELFVTDGTAAGTVLLKRIRMLHYCRCGDLFFFTGDDGVSGFELWRSDLTAKGTVLVKDIVPGAKASYPLNFLASQGRVFFNAIGPLGQELYVSDGTSAGTRLVVDLYPGPSNSGAGPAASASRGVLVGASVPSAVGGRGGELYFSDGTAAGTSLLCDLFPGSRSGLRRVTVCDGKVFLIANTPQFGEEVFVFNGSPATATTVGESCGKNPNDLRASNPILGATMTISGRRAPTTGARLLVIGGPGTPVGIPGIIAPECAVWEDLSLPILLAGLPGGSAWSLRVPIPNNPNLLGVRARMQAAYDPLPLSLSNAIDLLVGR
jgi:ELWxxDGT repeat protein